MSISEPALRPHSQTFLTTEPALRNHPQTMQLSGLRRFASIQITRSPVRGICLGGGDSGFQSQTYGLRPMPIGRIYPPPFGGVRHPVCSFHPRLRTPRYIPVPAIFFSMLTHWPFYRSGTPKILSSTGGFIGVHAVLLPLPRHAQRIACYIGRGSNPPCFRLQ
jgi:hypothetical protein